MASYVAARSRALAVPEDLSQRLLGRDALWECGGQLLSQAFGRAAPLVRPLLRRSFRHLLRVSNPSVIDGSMSGSHWFVPEAAPEGSDPALLKVDFDEGAFRGGAVHSYDAAFDLACAALDYESLDGTGSEFGDALRAAYASLGTEPVGTERWVLHQLLQLRARRWLHLYEHRLTRASAQSGTAQNEALVVQALGPMAREMSRIHERYFRDRFFSDVEVPADGPICAVDVDGVLETPWLGFPAITPAGALALRALARHGYRVVLATGRCIDEVQERCAAYGLAGGVAEYGAVIYNHHSGKARPLLSAIDETALSELRSILQCIAGVYLDPAHQHAVRAYRIQEDRRRGLDPETIEWALGKSDARQRLQAVPGGAQTDFITGAFNKGTGLRALAEDLNGAGPRGSSGPPVAMAVGDTASDLPMFEQAARAFAPANADAAVRRAGAAGLLRLKVLRRRHQPGLLLAAAALIGHQPGRCPRCQPPPLSGDAELLVRLLGVQDLGRWGKIQRALLLAAGRPGRDERSSERGSQGFTETARGPAKGMAR
jgi:hydroxymethylpyrimidine pyrophosphatase-like HAD family hydrolase